MEIVKWKLNTNAKYKHVAEFSVHIKALGLILNKFRVMKNAKEEFYWLAPCSKEGPKDNHFYVPYFELPERFGDFRDQLNKLLNPFIKGLKKNLPL